MPAGLEHVDDLVEAELERALLGARVNGLLREQALLLLQVNDALLDRVGDGELVDDNIHGLVQTVDAVDGLFLDKLVYMISGTVNLQVLFMVCNYSQDSKRVR